MPKKATAEICLSDLTDCPVHAAAQLPGSKLLKKLTIHLPGLRAASPSVAVIRSVGSRGFPAASHVKAKSRRSEVPIIIAEQTAENRYYPWNSLTRKWVKGGTLIRVLQGLWVPLPTPTRFHTRTHRSSMHDQEP